MGVDVGVIDIESIDGGTKYRRLENIVLLHV